MILTRRSSARLLLAAPLVAASCTRKGPAAPGRPLRVAVTPHIAMGPIYLGVERKYFEAEGLTVNLESSSLGRDAIPLISTGKLDAGMLSFSAALVNAIVRGARLRLVAGRERIVRGCGDGGALFARRGRFPKGFDDAASWRGVRTSVSTRAAYREYGWTQIERYLKLPEGAVQIQSMRNEDAMAAAISGRLDVIGGSVRPGYRDDLFNKYFERTDILERVLPEFQYSYVVFGPTLLDADPSLGARFLRAYLGAVRAFLAGETPQFLDRYAKQSGLDAALVKTSCRNTLSSDGRLKREDLKALVGWCVAKKYVERPISPEDLIDSRFLEGARQGNPS